MKKIGILLLVLLGGMLASCDIVDQVLISPSDYQAALDRIEALETELAEQYTLFSELSLEVVKSNVMIYTTCRSLTGISRKGGQGSGVIVDEDASSYYVLTNNHVVYCEPNYPRRSYEVTDYKMNSYNGEILFFDAEYDLALVKFSKTTELLVLALAEENPKAAETVIAIGQPEGQINAITFGVVLRYTQIICSTCDPLISNVTFECILHSAAISKGNSGGMLINLDKKIVGINTFGSENNGAAVPVEKILAFLHQNEYPL